MTPRRDRYRGAINSVRVLSDA
ncbi:hypothetical protein BN11_1980002 [Nostocoides australiense Ben110]|uniref:Uncharacterized protein n=1 Tax=Nostocoides australiense Ben110 TaxID=1193182 RepID=W6JVT6_9MICO|nr:hypothetical protein BN11_1980002 [Tetrasphaera australiensis Ben110]